MLNYFPALLSYNMAVPTVFRLIIGCLFIYFAYSNLTTNRESKIILFEKYSLSAGQLWLWVLVSIETLGGITLLVGIFTQISSMIMSVLLLAGLVSKQKYPDLLPWSKGFIFLLLMITASLLFIGPGLYSIDLPL
ncbi:MAG: DoxX family protein [Candidatus Taylorbacteria bacterium]|nr:DoxX family protein [Candidatus Taylorbacteria bacterium]